MEILPLSFYADAGFNVWVIWLLFTGSVWLTFLGVRFWVRLIKRMSVFEDSD